jgi:tryptophan synthase alpha chain
MSALSDRFEQLKARNEKALVLFVTAGDPPIEQLPQVLEALQEGGADIIELGIPFSDPIADGPTIQAGNQRALDRGMTPVAALDALAAIKPEVPVVLMGYYNPMLRFGLEAFAKRAKSSGAAGTIICDITPDEASDWVELSGQVGLDNIFLAAPTSTDARLEAVCAASSGFVYAVSRTGVTGALETLPDEVESLVSRLKARTALPVCVGFGISKPEHVRTICQVADGVVIGSWLVNWLNQNWDGGKGRAALVSEIKRLKVATMA